MEELGISLIDENMNMVALIVLLAAIGGANGEAKQMVATKLCSTAHYADLGSAIQGWHDHLNSRGGRLVIAVSGSVGSTGVNITKSNIEIECANGATITDENNHYMFNASNVSNFSIHGCNLSNTFKSVENGLTPQTNLVSLTDCIRCSIEHMHLSGGTAKIRVQGGSNIRINDDTITGGYGFHISVGRGRVGDYPSFVTITNFRLSGLNAWPLWAAAPGSGHDMHIQDASHVLIAHGQVNDDGTLAFISSEDSIDVLPYSSGNSITDIKIQDVKLTTNSPSPFPAFQLADSLQISNEAISKVIINGYQMAIYGSGMVAGSLSRTTWSDITFNGNTASQYCVLMQAKGIPAAAIQQDITMLNFSCNGAGNTSAGLYGVRTDYIAGVKLLNSTIQNWKIDGLYMNSSSGWTVAGNNFLQNGKRGRGYGIYQDKAGGGVVPAENSYIENRFWDGQQKPTQDGIRLAAGAHTYLFKNLYQRGAGIPYSHNLDVGTYGSDNSFVLGSTPPSRRKRAAQRLLR